MKKIYKTNLSTRIKGWIITSLCVFCFVYVLFLSFNALFDSMFIQFVGLLFVILMFVVFYKQFLLNSLYALSFGKLIISSEGVTYCCFLKKTIHISWKDCKFCAVEFCGDRDKLAYIYFSKKEIDNKFSGKINEKPNDHSFIKFFPVKDELCEEILKYNNYDTIRKLQDNQTNY